MIIAGNTITDCRNTNLNKSQALSFKKFVTSEDVKELANDCKLWKKVENIFASESQDVLIKNDEKYISVTHRGTDITERWELFPFTQQGLKQCLEWLLEPFEERIPKRLITKEKKTSSKKRSDLKTKDSKVEEENVNALKNNDMTTIEESKEKGVSSLELFRQIRKEQLKKTRKQ